MVADELELHLRAEADADALVFPAPHGGYLHLENFRKRVWLPAVRQAGLEPLRIHELRHTCASLAIAAGAAITVLKNMLGNAYSSLPLEPYGHPTPGQAESVAERLILQALPAQPPPTAPSAATRSRHRHRP